MKRAYLEVSNNSGYGHNVYLPKQFADECGATLSTFSPWAGFHRETELCYGYEIGHTEINDALSFLQSKGFVVEVISLQNAKKIWK